MKVTSKEFLARVEEIKERLIKDADFATMTAKAQEKKLKEITAEAMFTAVHELVAEGEKISTVVGTFVAKEKAERKNPARSIKHPVTGQTINIPESVTPAKTIIGLNNPTEIIK
jgi:nucleoid DNA-binding protein